MELMRTPQGSDKASEGATSEEPGTASGEDEGESAPGSGNPDPEEQQTSSGGSISSQGEDEDLPAFAQPAPKRRQVLEPATGRRRSLRARAPT